jgi:NADH:ubiquinone oxidoreductase subunit E
MAQSPNGGYLNSSCINLVAELTMTSPSKVLAKASHYSMLRLSKPRKHVVECCIGSSCFIGGNFVHKVIEAATGGSFQKGGSPDGEFDFIQVGCIGECSNGPWIRVDGVKYLRLTEDGIAKVLDKVKRGEGGDGEVFLGSSKPMETAV